MKKFPIITSVKSTVKAITDAEKKFSNNKFEFFQVSKFDDVMSFLKYEIPEIKIIDFGDKNTQAKKCLKLIEEDPWLMFGGVIAIVNTNAEKRDLEALKNPNFLFVITRKEFENHSQQIINILIQQERFLYNRRSHIDPSEIEEGSFVSETDPFEVSFYVNLLCTYLYNTNRLDENGRSAFQTTAMELLLNAVEHGNCGINYEEKNRWLKSGKNILDLIAEKRKDPRIHKKKIYISYKIAPNITKVTIRDEGKGFDWKKRLNRAFEPGLHGMGIKMSQQLVKNLTYNEVGNQVSFELDNQLNVANFTPAILKDEKITPYRHMQLVCTEGEKSENLFYICSGRFAVYVKNKLLTLLNPADIFLGEMAFLLDSRRTATIVSVGEGRLIKLPKTKFTNLIERHPHYGIFISKLLASRLERQSKAYADLKNEIEKLL
ncbi:MAG: cyclic nucleotide-binding domain-containing protein [Treponemataceae bacterium]